MAMTNQAVMADTSLRSALGGFGSFGFDVKLAKQKWQHYLVHHPLPSPKNQTLDDICQALKWWLKAFNVYLDDELQHYAVIDELLWLRSAAMDSVLAYWLDYFALCDGSVSLFALGGYGRCELLPYSDVDILLLTDGTSDDGRQDRLTAFVAALWDMGITPAISVHDVADILSHRPDMTTATSWLESRLVFGDEAKRSLLIGQVRQTWQVADFFKQKMQERQARYLAHDGTEYKLEPNIKTAPGGLRDIHLLLWLAKMQFEQLNAQDGVLALVQTGYLMASEATTLHTAQRFFWRVRHHLHTLTQRAEDRLLFTHQKNLAKHMGFAEMGMHPNDPPERLMKDYYRHAMTVASLCKMLCQLFAVQYLQMYRHAKRTPIGNDFVLMSFGDGDHVPEPIIAVKHARQPAEGLGVFFEKPATMLELFLLMGQYGVKKIAPNTSRQLRLACRQIDDTYRENPYHRTLFLQNLKTPSHLFHRLKLMKRHGVLGRYLPEFGKIMGLMQYDLFHRYTVDAHTLRLIDILHCLSLPQEGDFSLVAQVYQGLDKPYLLAIVSLFHDIAKGQGGDHSVLGAKLVKKFCSQHHLSNEDSKLVIWLVLEHLTMSLVAQKKDIHDPYVLAHFADFVGNQRYLDYLYVLTVVDMNATNAQLWNNWRATLLKQLYYNTRHLLRLDDDGDKPSAFIAARKSLVLQRLKPAIDAGDYQSADIERLWANLGDDYFAKESGDTIAWHSDTILRAYQDGTPLIDLRLHPDSELGLNAMQLLVYTSNQQRLFSALVGILDSCGFSVLEANILSFDQQALDTFVILSRTTPTAMADDGDLAVQFGDLLDKLKYHLKNTQDYRFAVVEQPYCAIPTAHAKLRHFDIATQVDIDVATPNQHRLHIITKDRPSLLASIAQVFDQWGVWVHRAKITTLGERVEDVFMISAAGNRPLSDGHLDKLAQALKLALQS